MKIAHIINLILIVLLLNLELVIPAGKRLDRQRMCSCPTTQGICNPSRRCDCCISKINAKNQASHHEDRARNKTGTSIYKMVCGEGQSRILPSSTPKTYILTEHFVLAFNRRSLLCKTLPYHIPQEQFISPPYKPPQIIS